MARGWICSTIAHLYPILLSILSNSPLYPRLLSSFSSPTLSFFPHSLSSSLTPSYPLFILSTILSHRFILHRHSFRCLKPFALACSSCPSSRLPLKVSPCPLIQSFFQSSRSILNCNPTQLQKLQQFDVNPSLPHTVHHGVLQHPPPVRIPSTRLLPT